MRIRWIAFLMICCLLTGAAHAEELTFHGQTFDSEAVSIDLGRITVYNQWDDLYRFLEQFPHLRAVDMYSTRVTIKRCEEMSSRFPNITFGWTLSFAEHTVRSDATAFSTLHFSGAKTHSSADISIVRYCKQLKALDIGHNGARDLSFLYDLPDLRVLIIACNKIEDLTPVGSLKKLEYLEVFSNQITDLTPLVGLEHLVDLNIGFNMIADLTPLYQMPQLQRLWMYNCINRNRQVKITDEQLAELKQHLPNTVIDTKHNPSEGGWRTGDHYDVIKRMFQNGVYEPFPDSFAE
ncbi:MAG: leucine-rich repeat domain-containing protein [Clostridia bacterium]|nr:leucine-rich repeat domain-containing protein [Clostridia bacterium]